jgi:hypothetical protein
MTEGVEEIGSGNGNGKVFVVDPNPIQNGIIPPEDMFIYVKFSAFPRNRVTYNGEGFTTRGVEDEVNFISTKIKYNNEGKVEPNPQQTYATTDWTNIGGFKGEDTRSSGVLEGFGIKSINIKYNASLVPVVDITFTDVRGSALFDVLSNDDILSPYSIFFKMPYPVFQLSVKGYFGQNVDYCLHMVNWNSQFDGSTGNFDISANFLGFQQAFLNDMVIGNIIGAINTQEGYNKLNDIYNETNPNFGLSSSSEGKSLEELQKSGKLNIRKLDDFFTRISKLKVESESLKDDLDSFKTLKFLNGKKSILKELQTFIGKPIGKEGSGQSKEDGTSKNYLDINNSRTQIETSLIENRQLIRNVNYFSVRDFLLINVISINNFKNYAITLNDIITKYNEYVTDDRNQEYQNTDSLGKLKNDIGKKQKGKITEKIDSVINYLNNSKDEKFVSLFDIKEESEDNWLNYVIDSQKPDGKIITNQIFSLKSVLEKMGEESTSEIYLTKNYDGGNDINNNFDLNTFNDVVKNKRFYNENMLPETVVLVADFREIREKLEDEIQSLEKVIKSQQEIVQEDLNEKLFNKSNNSENEFKLTIETCFEVLANNTQAMVEAIYEITKRSEDLGSERNNILKRLSSNEGTDIPTTLLNNLSEKNKSIAWPSFYLTNDDGSQRETYIGEINGVTRSRFPEYDFVERVFDNFISKREELQQTTKSSTLNSGTDTDNWFPINPMDYSVNPFLDLRFLNVEKDVIEYFVKQMLTRIALLQNYSLFDKTTGGLFEDYAFFDAKNAYETVKVNNATVLYLNKIIEKIKNDSNNLGPNSLIASTNFFKDNVEVQSPLIEYSIKEDKELPKIGNIEFGVNYNNPKIDYILYGKDYSEIINNSEELWSSIKQSTQYSNITSKDNKTITKKEWSGDLIYETKYQPNNNLYTNIIYNVWDKTIGNNLLKKTNTQSDFNTKNIKIEKFNKVALNDIDIFTVSDITSSNLTTGGDTTDENLSQTPTETSEQTPTNNTENTGIYLNKTYFNPNESENTLEDVFTNNTFYDQQSIFGRSYLLLSTIPYRDFKKGFLNALFQNNIYSGARIVELPELYLYYLGSLLWRNNQTTDPIVWNGYTDFETGKGKYPTKISYYKSINFNGEKDLEEELTNLPISVKNSLINKFKDWTKLNFNSTQNGKFESEFANYVNDTPNNLDSSKRYILEQLLKTTKIILLNPNIFNKDRQNKLFITSDKINTYVNKFYELFSGKANENSDTSGNNVEEEKRKKSEKNKKEIKLQIYNYFKNVNDKWVSDTEKSFNVCGGGDKNLIQYFRFIDRGWRPIGSQATINLNSFLSLGNNQDTSVYLFMSKILRDSNFLFQILPNYINYKEPTEVAKMFKPFTTIEKPDSSGPTYCCIYVGGASKALDIKETNNYYFNNDGFAFKNGQLPADMQSTDKAVGDLGDSSLVAFRVAFGAQNQTIFKNVSLNQQEHKETGEYFRALSDLVDKRGATQKTYQGTDLLRLFKTRSYTCQVDALGCMNIQPLMYFDLQNVPFFNGAYLITSVSHSITPNHMTTNFQGVRQSKYISPPTTSITADVDIDLNATNEIPKIEFQNLNNTNALYSVGVNSEIAGEAFEVDNISIQTLQNIGVVGNTLEILTDSDIQFIKDTIDGDSNADVAMFFANALANSNNFVNPFFKWENGEFSESEIKFGPESEFSGETKSYEITPINTFSNNEGEVTSTNLSFADDDTTTQANLSVNNNDTYLKYFTYTPTKSATTESIFINNIAYFFPNTPSELIEFNKVDYSSAEKLNKSLSNLKYLNIYQGDEYMYRPTGFLYMIGRKQYYDLFGEEGINNPQNYQTPENFKTAFEISYKAWKELKDSNDNTPSSYATNKVNNRLGSFTSFNQSRIASQQFPKGDTSIEKSAKSFEKVLQNFTYKKEPLIDLFNP